ncbi:MAG: MlaD family protein [Candidatus Obscuribacterales bacterium]|nr:MlaD family protein [Candidatus Obscuribacterales bacterium]
MARENFELRVGFFGLGAIFLTLSGLGWLKSFSLFEQPQTFWVRFHDVAGLGNNATVNVQGVRVGIVDKISFKLPDGLKDCPDANADDAKLPKVYAHIKVTGLSDIRIPESAEVTIQTLGLVGAKYVEITLPTEPTASRAAMDPNIIVEGKDPVRVELVVNNIARKLNHAADAVSSDEAALAIKHISNAAEKLDKTLDTIPSVTQSIKKATENFAVTASKFGKTADKADLAASNASAFFAQGKNSLSSVGTLAEGLSKTNGKVSRMLDNPTMTKDLKETVQLAHKTAQTVQAAIGELNSSVKDRELRQDLLAMLGKIQSSSDDIRQSMQVVNKLADDQGLREDVKVVLKDAKDAMNKANTMLADPGFKIDIAQTMGKVKSAASDVDVAAKQLHQILGKRAPLLHMMFGKPGELPAEKKLDGTSVNAKTGGYN